MIPPRAALIFVGICALGARPPVNTTSKKATSKQQAADTTWGPLRMLSTRVSTGTRALLQLPTGSSFSGQRLNIPVLTVRGAKPGPTLCLTAGVHGDELNGIEVVRRAHERANPDQLAGTILGLPVVNMHGFRRGSRYLPDRRDLNRHFPGHNRGSAASRIGYTVFSFLSEHCAALIDIHTGSQRRTNFPQIRADLKDPRTFHLALALQPPMVIQSPGESGMLRTAFAKKGVPAVTYEAGEAMRFQIDEIEGVTVSIGRLLKVWPKILTSSTTPTQYGDTQVIMRSRWIRVDHGGILTNRVGLGEPVKAGQILGVVQKPFSDSNDSITAPRDGMVIGLAQPQLVLPGFAAFHLGFEVNRGLSETPSTESEAAEEID